MDETRFLPFMAHSIPCPHQKAVGRKDDFVPGLMGRV